MSTPARKPALTKAPVRPHPLSPAETAAAAAADPLLAAILSRNPGMQVIVEGEATPEPRTTSGPTPPASRGMGTMTFRVDLHLRHEVKRYAFDHEMTVQTVVAEALREYLKKHLD